MCRSEQRRIKEARVRYRARPHYCIRGRQGCDRYRALPQQRRSGSTAGIGWASALAAGAAPKTARPPERKLAGGRRERREGAQRAARRRTVPCLQIHVSLAEEAGRRCRCWRNRKTAWMSCRQRQRPDSAIPAARVVAAGARSQGRRRRGLPTLLRAALFACMGGEKVSGGES